MQEASPKDRSSSWLSELGLRVPRVWLVAGGSWIGRGVQVLAQLAAVAILIDHLGTEGYAVFAVLASLLGWVLLSDFGLGFSIQNFISERRANSEEAHDIVLTGTILALISSIAVAFLVMVAGPWLSDVLLTNFRFLSPHDRTLAFYAAILPGVGTALGGVAYRIWFAQHRGYLSNLFPAVGTVIGTLAVWLWGDGDSEAKIAVATFLYYLPLALLPMAALGVLILRSRRHQHFRFDLVRPLLSRGAQFWLTGLLSAAVLQVDYIIMVGVLTANDIVIYNVAQKLFLLIFFVYNALLQALWPVCSEAIIRNDWLAVRKLMRNYMLFGFGFTLVAGLGVAIANPTIVHILARDLDRAIPLTVVALLTFYTMVRVWTDMYGIVLQSMNDIRIFWIIAVFQAILSIVLQTLGASYLGLPGMIAGLTGCYLLTAAWALPVRVRWRERAAQAQG